MDFVSGVCVCGRERERERERVVLLLTFEWLYCKTAATFLLLPVLFILAIVTIATHPFLFQAEQIWDRFCEIFLMQWNDPNIHKGK